MPSQPPADPHAELSASVSAGLEGLDDLLEHRSRLATCVLLSRADQLSFSRLKQLLNETDGNLGAQLRKLEDAGYLGVRKAYDERRPVSWYRLTPKGQKALIAHVDALGRLIGVRIQV